MTVSLGRTCRLPQHAEWMRRARNAPSSHDRNRLALFLLLSAAVHALLLGQRPPYVFERAAAAPGPMLRVTLTSERPRAPAPTISAEAPKAQKPERRPPAVVKPKTVAGLPASRENVPAAIPAATVITTRPEETAYAGPHPDAATEISVPDDSKEHAISPPLEARSGASEDDKSAGITEAAREAAIRGLLLRDLARHFQYPPLARRAGWEGTVLLSVTLDPDGVLAAVRVERSSGHQILDRAAADTLRRVGRIQETARWLQGQTLELLLPIVYRLTD